MEEWLNAKNVYMSNVNVQGVVKNHGARSNIFTPLVEAVVNSIDAIEERGIKDGEIKIKLIRGHQPSLVKDGTKSKADIVGFEIKDNGIGFNQTNRESFDTFYSPYKTEKGGKGFGRFMYKMYFTNVRVESVYDDEKTGKRMLRQFKFGDDIEIIDSASETNEVVDSTMEQWTSVTLDELKKSSYPKEIETLAKQLLEKILVFFITDKYNPPKITIIDSTDEKVELNQLVKDSQEIILQASSLFQLDGKKAPEEFTVKTFKIYSPGNQKSKIILTAHGREVDDTPLQNLMTEYADEFFDTLEDGKKRNYIVRAYVLGKYLNNSVNTERNAFEFEDDKELFHPISRQQIEVATLKELEKCNPEELESRRLKKVQKVSDFLDGNPWYKDYGKEIDLDSLPMNPTDQEIDTAVHKISYQKEVQVKAKVNKLLDELDIKPIEKADEIFALIGQVKKNELAHYLSLRRVFLSILSKALKINDTSRLHEKEDLLHNIIFPTKKDSDNVTFNEHNLWILDERLNFVEYLRSDEPIKGGKSKRPDLLAFDKAVIFRDGDEASNPVTIFEFKRPGRDDFTNKSSKEDDPHDQVVEYVQMILKGQYSTPDGREIKVGDNTPFYAYIIADKSHKVEEWLKKKDFHPLPNNQRWFKWQTNYNLYLEFVTWDQVLNDAELRNAVFFKKLGI